MEYRIEKREGFEIIAKRARYGGGQEIGQKNICATWAACGADGTLDTLCGYINPENIFGGWGKGRRKGKGREKGRCGFGCWTWRDFLQTEITNKRIKVLT